MKPQTIHTFIDRASGNLKEMEQMVDMMVWEPKYSEKAQKVLPRKFVISLKNVEIGTTRLKEKPVSFVTDEIRKAGAFVEGVVANFLVFASLNGMSNEQVSEILSNFIQRGVRRGEDTLARNGGVQTLLPEVTR